MTSHPIIHRPHRTIVAAIGFVLALAFAVNGPLPQPAAAGAARLWAAAAPGDPLWVARHAGPYDDVAASMAVSPDGTMVYATGFSSAVHAVQHYLTVAYYAASGAEAWTAGYDGPGRGDDRAIALALSPDGDTVFVTGQIQSSGHGTDFGTLAYDAATGEQRWFAEYNSPSNSGDLAYAIAVSSDGATVYVSGPSYGANVYDFATVAYDAATGGQRWVARYNGPGSSYDIPYDVAASPDGSLVYVTGASPGAGTDYDYATIAYDGATGHQVWLRRYNGPGNSTDFPWAEALSPDGATVYVTGYATGIGTRLDATTVAYDGATGRKRWVSRYNGPGNSVDMNGSIAVSPDGGTVYAGGQTTGPSGTFDYLTIAYEAGTGARLWVSRYKGRRSGFDSVSAVTPSPGGAWVYVTGGSFGHGTKTDWATIAYDAATGSRAWVQRYDGPADGYDGADALVVSPDGSVVYASGASQGIGTDSDFTTIAYRAR